MNEGEPIATAEYEINVNVICVCAGCRYRRYEFNEKIPEDQNQDMLN